MVSRQSTPRTWSSDSENVDVCSVWAVRENTSRLQAAAALALAASVEVSLFDGLGNLPRVNPDLDGETVSQSVKDWMSRLRASDGVVFSVPKYAHGVLGVLKNGLDWVVRNGELVDKTVTLFNASPRGTYAQAFLTETLTVMSAKVVSEALITLQLLGKPVSAGEIARIRACPLHWASRGSWPGKVHNRVDECRDEDTSQRPLDRQRCLSCRRELPYQEFALNLQYNDREEDGHETIVDPEVEIVVE